MVPFSFLSTYMEMRLGPGQLAPLGDHHSFPGCWRSQVWGQMVTAMQMSDLSPFSVLDCLRQEVIRVQQSKRDRGSP